LIKLVAVTRTAEGINATADGRSAAHR
jgi:hypothetical protein